MNIQMQKFYISFHKFKKNHDANVPFIRIYKMFYNFCDKNMNIFYLKRQNPLLPVNLLKEIISTPFYVLKTKVIPDIKNSNKM